MNKILKKIKEIFSFILVLHFPVGGIYWAYASFEIVGSFLMFWCVCIMPISIPVGIYMFYFGIPDWIFYLFG